MYTFRHPKMYNFDVLLSSPSTCVYTPIFYAAKVEFLLNIHLVRYAYMNQWIVRGTEKKTQNKNIVSFLRKFHWNISFECRFVCFSLYVSFLCRATWHCVTILNALAIMAPFVRCFATTCNRGDWQKSKDKKCCSFFFTAEWRTFPTKKYCPTSLKSLPHGKIRI